MPDVKAVQFPNVEGLRLHGMLHLPERLEGSKVGIVLLSPGVKTKVGPHGLYCRMADQFARQGFPVLRFDFFGLGDSEGELTETTHSDLHTEIQLGRYKGDTIRAVEYLIDKVRVKRVILGGLCGGAVTGLLAGAKDTRVAGLLALGIPAILDNRTTLGASTTTAGQLDRIRNGYVRKLLDPKAWLRLLSFQTDYKTLLRSLLLRRRKDAAALPSGREGGGNKAGTASNVNHLFKPACFDFLSRAAPLLFVFSGSDRLQWEFEEKFFLPNRDALKRFESHYEIHTIPNANHILSLPEWEEEMLRIAGGWLSQKFGAALFTDALEVSVAETAVVSSGQS